jgi:hypothetical protein
MHWSLVLLQIALQVDVLRDCIRFEDRALSRGKEELSPPLPL